MEQLVFDTQGIQSQTSDGRTEIPRETEIEKTGSEAESDERTGNETTPETKKPFSLEEFENDVSGFIKEEPEEIESKATWNHLEDLEKVSNLCNSEKKRVAPPNFKVSLSDVAKWFETILQ